MATQGRESETQAAPPRPKFTPQVGRKYIQLIHRETGRTELVLLDEWERMEGADGRTAYAPVSCSYCGGYVIKQLFARDEGRLRWLETCPHLEGAGK